MVKKKMRMKNKPNKQYSDSRLNVNKPKMKRMKRKNDSLLNDYFIMKL